VEHDCAWDSATGNGQAAIALADYYNTIIASDASFSQISNAIPNAWVNYYVDLAEKTAIPNRCLDLITVAQALHWFDFDKFYLEVERVLKPQGILAVWCLPLMTCIDTKVQDILEYFYLATIGPYWPPERRHNDTRYKLIPFNEIKPPNFEMCLQWTLAEFLGYIETWSAVQQYKNVTKTDPIAIKLLPQLNKMWKIGQKTKQIMFDSALRVGRVNR
jgi:ubiquinone/menaquinone biosynthesis C-methylase UbiE